METMHEQQKHPAVYKIQNLWSNSAAYYVICSVGMGVRANRLCGTAFTVLSETNITSTDNNTNLYDAYRNGTTSYVYHNTQSTLWLCKKVFNMKDTRQKCLQYMPKIVAIHALNGKISCFERCKEFADRAGLQVQSMQAVKEELYNILTNPRKTPHSFYRGSHSVQM